MMTEHDEDAEEVDPVAHLYAMQEQSRSTTDGFSAWMDQQLAEADAANAARHQANEATDAAMWDVVQDFRTMRGDGE
jgi:hypothetical protein